MDLAAVNSYRPGGGGSSSNFFKIFCLTKNLVKLQQQESSIYLVVKGSVYHSQVFDILGPSLKESYSKCKFWNKETFNSSLSLVNIEIFQSFRMCLVTARWHRHHSHLHLSTNDELYLLIFIFFNMVTLELKHLSAETGWAHSISVRNILNQFKFKLEFYKFSPNWTKCLSFGLECPNHCWSTIYWLRSIGLRTYSKFSTTSATSDTQSSFSLSCSKFFCHQFYTNGISISITSCVYDFLNFSIIKIKVICPCWSYLHYFYYIDSSHLKTCLSNCRCRFCQHQLCLGHQPSSSYTNLQQLEPSIVNVDNRFSTLYQHSVSHQMFQPRSVPSSLIRQIMFIGSFIAAYLLLVCVSLFSLFNWVQIRSTLLQKHNLFQVSNNLQQARKQSSASFLSVIGNFKKLNLVVASVLAQCVFFCIYYVTTLQAIKILSRSKLAQLAQLNKGRLLAWPYLLIGVLLICSSGPVAGGSHERRLLHDLLKNYQILERPVANESDPLIVSFGLTLQQIIDVDEKNQQIISNIWLRLEWVDTNLRWKPSDYGGIEDLRISPDKVWRPDILMYNSADEKFDATYHSNVVVQYNGSCLYIPPGIFKSTCKIDITWFPFDDQFCNLKFGSWSYHGFALDLRLSSEEGDVSTYIPNGEWVLMGVPGKRNEEKYDCCVEPFIDITFTIGLRRRTLYYGFNLIVPSVIISSMTLLSFTLPPDSGEKLTLGVTILLSMIVFLMQLAEIMPATSDSVSIVGSYFACIMVMVAFSVVMTVVVLNFHHRTTEQQQEMPRWIRTVILTWLPIVLRIKKTPELFRSSANFERNNAAAAAAAVSAMANMKSGLAGAPITPPPLRGPCLPQHDHVEPFGWDIPGSQPGPMPAPDPLSPSYNYSPSSPTHQELAILTEKMHEYELLCHKRGCPYITSQQTRFPLNNHQMVRDGYPPVPRHNGGYEMDGDLLTNHLSYRHNGPTGPPASACPYSFSTFPPPPPHSHQFEPNRHHQPHPQQDPAYPHEPGNGAGSYLFTLMQEEASMHFSRGNNYRLGGTGDGEEPPLQENNPCCCCCCTGGQTSGPGSGSSSHEYFQLIMQEFRFITNRLRREDDLTDIIAEWKFAAIVIDRLCLIMFSTFAIISTAVCLLSAPHLIA